MPLRRNAFALNHGMRRNYKDISKRECRFRAKVVRAGKSVDRGDGSFKSEKFQRLFLKDTHFVSTKKFTMGVIRWNDIRRRIRKDYKCRKDFFFVTTVILCQCARLYENKTANSSTVQ